MKRVGTVEYGGRSCGNIWSRGGRGGGSGFPHCARRDSWRLEHEEQRVSYVTKEAAFEAAVLGAQRAMRAAHAVHICVDPAPNVLMDRDQNFGSDQNSGRDQN